MAVFLFFMFATFSFLGIMTGTAALSTNSRRHRAADKDRFDARHPDSPGTLGGWALVFVIVAAGCAWLIWH